MNQKVKYFDYEIGTTRILNYNRYEGPVSCSGAIGHGFIDFMNPDGFTISGTFGDNRPRGIVTLSDKIHTDVREIHDTFDEPE